MCFHASHFHVHMYITSSEQSLFHAYFVTYANFISKFSCFKPMTTPVSSIGTVVICKCNSTVFTILQTRSYTLASEPMYCERAGR